VVEPSRDGGYLTDTLAGQRGHFSPTLIMGSAGTNMCITPANGATLPSAQRLCRCQVDFWTAGRASREGSVSGNAVEHDEIPADRDHELSARPKRYGADVAEVQDGDLVAGGDIPDPHSAELMADDQSGPAGTCHAATPGTRTPKQDQLKLRGIDTRPGRTQATPGRSAQRVPTGGLNPSSLLVTAFSTRAAI
jgi:hypothetical protein